MFKIQVEPDDIKTKTASATLNPSTFGIVCDTGLAPKFIFLDQENNIVIQFYRFSPRPRYIIQEIIPITSICGTSHIMCKQPNAHLSNSDEHNSPVYSVIEIYKPEEV